MTGSNPLVATTRGRWVTSPFFQVHVGLLHGEFDPTSRAARSEVFFFSRWIFLGRIWLTYVNHQGCPKKGTCLKIICHCVPQKTKNQIKYQILCANIQFWGSTRWILFCCCFCFWIDQIILELIWTFTYEHVDPLAGYFRILQVDIILGVQIFSKQNWWISVCLELRSKVDIIMIFFGNLTLRSCKGEKTPKGKNCFPSRSFQVRAVS